MLVSDFMVKIYAEKYSKVFPWNTWNVLTRMNRKNKKWQDDQSAISAKLVDIANEPYGFSADLVETVNW